jgi:Bacterial SH3 domain
MTARIKQNYPMSSFKKVLYASASGVFAAFSLAIIHPKVIASTVACYEVTDPDGWVNVRDRETGEVVARMDNGARFLSLYQTLDGMVIIATHNQFVVNPKRLKAIRSDESCRPYTVMDRDGYVNLRSTPNGAVISAISSGSSVLVTARADEWWRVLTADGRSGFVHSSRLVRD